MKLMKWTVLCGILFFSLSAYSKSLTKVRIGWQVPWATQGQIVQIFKHTDILKKNGLEAEFIGRTYGPLLNELALADKIDVVLTADQPAVALFSKDKGWKGIGRLMYNRTLTYVPPQSKIKSVKELKGKIIAIPMGAAAERITVSALKDAKLNPKKDTRLINLGLREQVPLIEKYKGEPKWGNIDALSGFDPLPAILESNKKIRVLHVGKVCSMVLMNDQFIKKHPKVATQLMSAVKDAYDYYRKNVKKANDWFMKEARLSNANQKACNIAASIEPNLEAKNKSEIRVSFNDDDFRIVEEASKFMEPKLKKKVDVKKFLTNEYVK